MNTAALAENYDFLVATVVFMFLDAGRVPAIIENMQAHTTPGGYNLIVSAMDTEDHPCVMPFSFTFREGELKKYYEGWEMAEYREEIGSMHATDAQGKPIQLKFVTMLARKPA
jgi:hemagglutinin 1